MLEGVELQLSVHAAVLGASAVASTALLAVTVRNRSERIALPLGLLIAVTTIWAIADTGRLLVASEAAMYPWLLVRAVVGSYVGSLYLWLVLAYLDRDDLLHRETFALLFAIPSATFVLVFTGVRTDLVVAGAETVAFTDPLFGTTYTWLEGTFGPWFLLNSAYDYLLVVAGFALLARSLLGAGDVAAHRRQTVAMVLASTLPLVVNASVHLGVLPIDLTTTSFVVTLGLISAAIFRYDLFTLHPIARDSAVENMDEGFFVLDRENRIVDCNPAAAEMVGPDGDEVVDRPIRDVFPGFHDVVADADPGAEFTTELETAVAGEPAYYDVTASPILDTRDRHAGRVVLVQDVTERVRRKKQLQERTTELAARTDELERQNERLEEFASVLSHDLRNPLGVAESYLERARRTGDPDDFDAVEESLDRIGTLVEDLLTLARQGQTVRDPEPVALDDVARTAWDHVDTPDATLRIEADAVVAGDEARLLQVFENLFRNALEHGSRTHGAQPTDDSAERLASDDAAPALRDGGADAVVDRDDSDDRSVLTVRVGDAPDGFFVEDDGPGVPPGKSDRVFERGFSTESDGTGLGLAIVKHAVEAHGWSIRLSEGTAGGARFEIDDVDPRPPED